MLINYGADSIDIDFNEDLNFATDYNRILAQLVPQKKLSFKTSKPTKHYVDFDYLTEGEIALINFMRSVEEYKHVMLEKVFPSKEHKLYNYAKQIGAKYEFPAINPYEYAVYKKCVLLQRYTDLAFNLSVYGRLGCDLEFTYDGAGAIYSVKDLRELLSAVL